MQVLPKKTHAGRDRPREKGKSATGNNLRTPLLKNRMTPTTPQVVAAEFLAFRATIMSVAAVPNLDQLAIHNVFPMDR
jgi:hypothetical protein